MLRIPPTSNFELDDDENRIAQELLSQKRVGAPAYGDVEAAGLPVDRSLLMSPEGYARHPFGGAMAGGDMSSALRGGGIVASLLAGRPAAAMSGSPIASTANMSGVAGPMATPARGGFGELPTQEPRAVQRDSIIRNLLMGFARRSPDAEDSISPLA